jgi:DNA invertase Pin-like site-specific DNA recombinase
MAAIGYARVSTTQQDPGLQLDALDKAGCERVFVDKASGSKADRPELAAALAYVREGDVLVVWKLDRLGRSLSHLIEVTTGLAERGVQFRSITEGLDTTTAGGRLVFNIMGALAQFERDLIIERTRAGLEAARARGGGKGGRKPVMTASKLAVARRMIDEDEHTMDEVAATIGVSRATLYRHL